MLLCVGLGVFSIAAAQQLDPATSNATFTLRVALLRRIEGKFPAAEGRVEHDHARGTFAVDVRLDSRRLQMSNARQARWAQSAEFFDSARHPWLRFVAVDLPSQLLKEGGEFEGRLTLRGVTRRTRFILDPADCERSGHDCALTAHGSVRRADFGMHSRRWIVGDRVLLRLRFRVLPSAVSEASP